MATGTGNLPYSPTYVSPFDLITSQAENETQDNISALADGSGIGDGALNGAVVLQDNSVPNEKLDVTRTSWSVSIASGLNVGSTGSIVGSHTKIGKIVYIEFLATLGGTGISVGDVNIVPPFPISTTGIGARRILGPAELNDVSASAVDQMHNGVVVPGGVNLRILAQQTGGTANRFAALGSTTPFGWVAGDSIDFAVWYRTD